VHSNGFSLLRKIFKDTKEDLMKEYEGLMGTIGEELLKPTKIYVKEILNMTKKYDVRAIAHITGGGFIENIPRMLPEGLSAIVIKGSWPIPEIFEITAREGEVSEKGMYNTFNMGIGLVVCVPEKDSADICDEFEAFEIGYVEKGDTGITIR
jgi:phosphoribosylformylglycinamidine cyclo-ligase